MSDQQTAHPNTPHAAARKTVRCEHCQRKGKRVHGECGRDTRQSIGEPHRTLHSLMDSAWPAVRNSSIGVL